MIFCCLPLALPCLSLILRCLATTFHCPFTDLSLPFIDSPLPSHQVAVEAALKQGWVEQELDKKAGKWARRWWVTYSLCSNCRLSSMVMAPIPCEGRQVGPPLVGVTAAAITAFHQLSPHFAVALRGVQRGRSSLRCVSCCAAHMKHPVNIDLPSSKHGLAPTTMALITSGFWLDQVGSARLAAAGLRAAGGGEDNRICLLYGGAYTAFVAKDTVFDWCIRCIRG